MKVEKQEQWLITVDLDGTLLNTNASYVGAENDEIHPKIKEVFKKILAQGHKIAIVTGRPWEDSKPIYKALGSPGLIANFNGAHIHNPTDPSFNDIHFSINSKLLKELLSEEEIASRKTSVVVESIGTTYVDNKEDMKMQEMINLSEEALSTDWNIEDWVEKDPQSVLIGLDVHDIEDPYYSIYHKLKRKYGNAVELRFWGKKDADWILLEVNLKTANKGNAMLLAAHYYNIPVANSIAFGDGLNDREMLMHANVGVAMSNAKGTIKSFADDSTDFSNAEGGVGYYLEEFFNLK